VKSPFLLDRPGTFSFSFSLTLTQEFFYPKLRCGKGTLGLFHMRHALLEEGEGPVQLEVVRLELAYDLFQPPEAGL
jgi:hypothetical protein